MFEGTGAPLSAAGFTAAANKLGIANDTASLWALLAVETRGFGYLPDKRPKILFERHIFHRRTGGRFSRSNPDISNAAAGGYIGGAEEYQRLKRAMLLDRRSALESASWGLGQVMGFNALDLGYASVEEMVEIFKEGEDQQLDASARFVSGKPALAKALAARDWPRVAFFYNGKSYAANRYDTKLAERYGVFKSAPPDVDVRAIQALLTYVGFNPKGVDGVWGGGTQKAFDAFLTARKIPPPHDRATVFGHLKKAAGF